MEWMAKKDSTIAGTLNVSSVKSVTTHPNTIQERNQATCIPTDMLPFQEPYSLLILHQWPVTSIPLFLDVKQLLHL